jgi:hypothetical protein
VPKGVRVDVFDAGAAAHGGDVAVDGAGWPASVAPSSSHRHGSTMKRAPIVVAAVAVAAAARAAAPRTVMARAPSPSRDPSSCTSYDHLLLMTSSMSKLVRSGSESARVSRSVIESGPCHAAPIVRKLFT